MRGVVRPEGLKGPGRRAQKILKRAKSSNRIAHRGIPFTSTGGRCREGELCSGLHPQGSVLEQPALRVMLVLAGQLALAAADLSVQGVAAKAPSVTINLPARMERP